MLCCYSPLQSCFLVAIFARYLLTDGEYLRTTDLWRGGNVRAVLEVGKTWVQLTGWVVSESGHWFSHSPSTVHSKGKCLLKAAFQEFGLLKKHVFIHPDYMGVWLMPLSLRFWAGHEASTTGGQQAGGVGMDLEKSCWLGISQSHAPSQMIWNNHLLFCFGVL